MQYAKIAVKTKTSKIDQLFTYSIPPAFLPYVNKGILVEISFGKRKTQGVIFEITKNIDSKYKNKIKPILKIIDLNPVLNELQIELTKWMSAYYLCPIGEVVFATLPPIAHRSILKGKIKNIKQDNKLNGSVYTIYDRECDRINTYKKLIRKALSANRQSIIVLSDWSSKKVLIESLVSEFGEKSVALINSQNTLTKRYKNWQDAKLEKKKIIIGTRWSLFCFTQNIGLIIVDNPHDYGHKEDQAPRYMSVSIAKKIQELTKCNLILGSFAPNLKNIINKYKIVQDNFSKSLNRNSICLIDKTSSRAILTWQAENKIENNLKNNKKTLILANHKGEGSLLSCLDCGHEFICPKCSVNLTPIKNKNNQTMLICAKCGKTFIIPDKCPKCNSVKLAPRGLALGFIQKKIQKFFPKANIALFEKDNEQNIKNIINKNDIIISTKKILDFEFVKFDLSIILNIDNFLNFPDYTVYENILTTVVKLINISSDIVIQTNKQDNDFIKMFNGFDFDKICKFILNSRKASYYPPYGELIKLIYKNSSDIVCQKETEKIIYKIQALNLKNIDILGPIPCYVSKKRNKYYWQIVIKIKNDFRYVKSKLKNISFSSDWSIDAEPLDLL